MRAPQIVGLQIDRVHEHQQTGRRQTADGRPIRQTDRRDRQTERQTVADTDATRTFSLCVNYAMRVRGRASETDTRTERYKRT